MSMTAAVVLVAAFVMVVDSPGRDGGEQDQDGHGRDDRRWDGSGIGWRERDGRDECAAASAAAAARRQRTGQQDNGGCGSGSVVV